jgi:hypothetical protein
VHPDVIRMLVATAAGVRVADEHLRLLGADDAHQAADGFVEVGVGEVVRVGVVLGVGHPGVAVAEQIELVVSDDPDALGELPHADGTDVGPGLGAVGLLVQDVARLTAGAADEHGPYALGRVAGHGGCTLGGFVVRMGMDREHAQPRTVVSHGVQSTRGPAADRPSWGA